MRKLSQLESIGVKFTALLQQAGIENQQQLLTSCCQRNGRLALAAITGINLTLIYKWTTEADLARISGIGEDYAQLLEHSGVDCVQVLAQFSAEKLFQTMQKINEQKKLVRQMPSLSQVETWVEDAKLLPSILAR